MSGIPIVPAIEQTWGPGGVQQTQEYGPGGVVTKQIWAPGSPAPLGLVCPIPIFPSLALLPGRGFSLHRKQIFSTLKQTTFLGRESRMYQQFYPFWEFTLLFNELRDQTQNQTPYSGLTNYTEFQELSQFINWASGTRGSFYFDDPDDDSRLGQFIATGDAATTIFSVIRTLNPTGAYTTTEFVGAVNFNLPIAVYLNGVLQSASTYSIAGNLLMFTTPPGNGVTITMDFYFWFLCRFTENKQQYSEFHKNRWEAQKIQFRSLLLTHC